jgi:hypothetical protein
MHHHFFTSIRHFSLIMEEVLPEPRHTRFLAVRRLIRILACVCRVAVRYRLQGHDRPDVKRAITWLTGGERGG